MRICGVRATKQHTKNKKTQPKRLCFLFLAGAEGLDDPQRLAMQAVMSSYGVQRGSSCQHTQIKTKKSTKVDFFILSMGYKKDIFTVLRMNSNSYIVIGFKRWLLNESSYRMLLLLALSTDRAISSI